MKVSYQQLFIMFLCMSQSISAVTLYNESNSTIRFNIFKKNFIQQGYNIDPLPKKFGKIAPHSSQHIKNLDPKYDYIVTFYDVYNFQNNKIMTFKGSTKKLSFEPDNIVQ